MEQWKDVKGYEGRYRISNTGRLISINGRWRGEREMKGAIDSSGYVMFALRNGGKKAKCIRGHQLVALHFVENPKPNLYNCVDHINMDRVDNNYKNLRWCTNAQNIRFAAENGAFPKGEKHHNSKLTKDSVIKIKRLQNKGMNNAEIGNMFGVHRRTISDIYRNKTWLHVTI